MSNRLELLRQKHRRLYRLIDTCKAAGLHDEMQQLKRIRLRIKDALVAAERKIQIPQLTRGLRETIALP